MPPPLFPGAEGLGFRRWMIVVVACLFAVWAGVTLAESPYVVFAGFAGLLYVGTLSVNARTLAWLVIALQPAALIVPFFPGRPFWWELCALLAWPSLLVYFLVNRKQLADLKFDRLEKRALLALLGYVGVLVVLMLYRGVGFRAFGGGQMGGRFYAQQIILAVLPVLFLATPASRKGLMAAMITSWILSLTYLVSDFSFSLTGSLHKVLYFFELPADAVNFELGFEVSGLRRYQSLSTVSTALLAALVVSMSLRDLAGRCAWFGIPSVVGVVAIGLFSGYRTAFIQSMLVLFFLTVFQRFWSLPRLVFSCLMVAVFAAVLYWSASSLPLAIQRSISFLPGVEVTQLARDNAADTLNDRIEVLKLAVNDVPRYALVGRGFGMDRFDKLPSDAAYSGVWLQYINGYYYNGLLGSLLKMGVFGLVCTLAFIIYVSKIALQVVRVVQAREMHEMAVVDRLGLLVCAQWFSSVSFFYLLHGDAGVWGQFFILPASLIIMCKRLLSSEVGQQLESKL